MNKKIISISLILIMIVCNSMTVWAAEEGKEDIVTDMTDNSKQQDVTASFTMADSGEIYSVTIEWGALDYEPTETLTGKWNIAGYYEITNENVQWKASSEGAGTIKVTNNSNVDIGAKLTGTIDEDFRNSYFIDNSTKKQSAKFDFSQSASTEHTCTTWNLNNNEVHFALGTSAKTDTDLCAVTEVGVTAQIEKANKLENTDKKMGHITIELEGLTEG